jgi:Predicted dehydrogenases and related proteins
MKKIRVAVIGAGHLGKIHARIYAQCHHAELVGICDNDPEKSAQTAADFTTRAFNDYRQLFSLVDAVSIATPTTSHFAIARDFLRHGIHVMVEKTDYHDHPGCAKINHAGQEKPENSAGRAC